MKKYGYKKGSLQQAAKDVLDNWIRDEEEYGKIPKVKDPFRLLEGILKKYRGKITSVEL